MPPVLLEKNPPLSLFSPGNDEIMPISPVFNPGGDDSVENRSIWFGDTTNLMQLNSVRYEWATQLYRQMRANFWVAEKIDLTQDINDYQNLTQDEMKAYDGILSFLTFLDSTQTCNIPHLKIAVTAPEIHLCLAEQLSQESLHNQSYQYLIDTVIPQHKRNYIYEYWRTDDTLFKRCSYIADIYQRYVSNPTPENYFTALLADYILEGLYFYNGFQFFYSLSSRQLMPGTSDMIKMINRDELSHVRLYQKLLPEAMEVFPHSLEEIYSMFNAAVQHEINWTNHIIGDNILGITESSTEQYTKYLANIRLRAINLPPLFTQDKYNKSPYNHLEKLADTNADATVKANFFESTVTSYMQSSAVNGWEEL